MSSRRKRWAVVLLAIATGAFALVVWPFVATAALLLDLGGHGGRVRTVLPVRAVATSAEIIAIPTRHGAVTARVDRPIGGADHTLVVLPGVHVAGLEEPRLTRFSTRLAGAGITVVSVPLPDLRRFRIVGRATDQAEDATVWIASNRRLAPRGRVSLAGISFAGGLALVAAGRPSLAGRLDAVVSLGGHGDLGRVLEFVCTGQLPDGTSRAPHDYSVAVAALAAVSYLVPPDEVAGLERGIELFLDASADETPDRTRATTQLAEARRLQARMPPRSREIMEWAFTRNVAAAGAAVRPFIERLAADAALSPERSPAPAVPVFLLHGLDDNVIPPTEPPRLARYLEQNGTPRVRWLLTPVLSHVGIDTRVGAGDWWRLLRFWRALEDAIES